MSRLSPLPAGIISRNIAVNDLDVHILEALPSERGPDPPKLIVLLHGFPELAYSWRKIIVPLAEAGYHVVAPDRRGFGRTTPRDEQLKNKPVQYTDDLAPYRLLNIATDIVALAYTLGHKSVALVVGHDSGSEVAALCALARADFFKAVVLMSAPYTGPPDLAAASSSELSVGRSSITAWAAQLAALDPPRKHYVLYYMTPVANGDLLGAPQGLPAFFRAYYHVKSGDWDNAPFRLPSLAAAELAQMPHYYIMPLHETMPAAVATHAPAPEEAARCKWLTEDEVAVYAAEYARTGFQGGLNAYRIATDPQWVRDLVIFAGKRVEVPAMFLSGTKDWGVYQRPGAAEAMRDVVCEKMGKENFVLIDGAGHWVQQEKPEEVTAALLGFLQR